MYGAIVTPSTESRNTWYLEKVRNVFRRGGFLNAFTTGNPIWDKFTQSQYREGFGGSLKEAFIKDGTE